MILLRGGPGHDVIQGGPGDDGLQGGGGDDTVGGGPGADRLRGATGGDRLSGGAGRDVTTYMPRAAAMRLSIGDGANDGRRGEGDDIAADIEDVRGGLGNDTLIGSAGPNRLFGLMGNDRVVGGRGNDVMAGGAGTDVLDGRDGPGFVDVLSCGAGAGDRVLADMTDTVGAGCENVVQNDPPTGVVISDDTVAENRPVGTLVGTLSATDPDPGDTHTFTLVTGAGSADNGSFTITGARLRTDEVFDFETKDSYSIRVRARDAEGAFVAEPLTISIVGADEPPVAVDDTATVAEDAAATGIDVLANDTDVDGGPRAIGSVTQPANGTVVITGAGSGLTYQPDPDFCNDPPGTTPDTFTYTLNGGSIGTVAVTVTCADDAPVAVDDTATVVEDAAATGIDVLANDTDVEDDPITVTSVTQPANGTVVITAGGTAVTYEPDPDYCNSQSGGVPDSFSYTINGGSTATVEVTVTCVDDPPVAVDDTATVAEDDPATAIPVLDNDTDVDGGPRTIETITQPADGTVVITGGGSGLTYQPDSDYCNDPPGTTPDTFTYTINGGSTATVSVTVTCVDDAPVAVDDTATVAEDSGASAVDVLANDTDLDGGPKVIGSVTQPANGTVVITGAGSGLTYQPDPNYCNSQAGGTPDTFSYTLNGGSQADVAVTVTCVDDTPVAGDDTATVAEDSGASAVDVLANDVDPDGGVVTIGSVTQPANGTVVITGGGTGLTYQPNANYCNSQAGGSPDTFSYTINGGDSATVSVTVTCVDDPPVAVNDTATVAEDAAATAVDVLANDTDLDGGPKVIGSVTQPANGTVVITGAGSGLTYRAQRQLLQQPDRRDPGHVHVHVERR